MNTFDRHLLREWFRILGIVLLIFGTKKLKNIGSDLGGAVKGFKDGMRDANDTSTDKPAAQVTGQTIDVQATQDKAKT